MSAPDTDVLIAGGGLAAQRCAAALRRLGYGGRIVLLCEESRPPYDRPPLSKTVLSGAREPTQLQFKPAQWYAEQQIELLVGHAAEQLDVGARTVFVRDEARVTHPLRYRQLVIATGSRPRRLPGFEIGWPVCELRTAEDSLSLRARLRDGDGRLAVIGAGLIGMEVASSARALGCEVTLIEAAPTPLARALPAALGRWIADLHRRHGVDVRLSTTVERVSLRSRDTRIALSDGTVVRAGTVLVAAGTEPATGWLAESPLGRGAIYADLGGRTAVSGVFAAGDAACFPDPHLRRSIPTQHWEAAVRQGVAVARTIVGLEPAPVAPAMFWSDQHGRRIQLVGHAAGGCELDFEGDVAADEPFVAWINRRGAAAGALLVDRPDALARARRRIAEGSHTTELSRAARDPNDPAAVIRCRHTNSAPNRGTHDISTADRPIRLSRARRL